MREHHARILPLALLAFFIGIALYPVLSHAQDAAEYRRRANVLRQAVQRCSQRLLAGDITACNINVGFGINRNVSMPEALRLADEFDVKARQADNEAEKAYCISTRDRYLRDMEQVRRMQQTIEMGERELADWTRQNEEAQYDAIKTALNLLVDGGLAYLADSKAACDGLKGALAKYEKQLKLQKRRPDPLQRAKWLDMSKRIAEMEMAMSAAKDLQNKKEKAEIFWHYFTANTRDVDQSVNSFKGTLNAAQEDPLLHKLLVEKGLMPLFGKLETKELFPKKPYLINLAEFARDYGYDIVKWTASRNRIVQQYNVSDEQRRAVNAMQEELKKTMAAVNECVSRGFIARP